MQVNFDQYAGSDDEFDRLDIDQFQEILDDPDHPAHERAKAVSRELAGSLRVTADELLKPLNDSLTESITRVSSAFKPQLGTLRSELHPLRDLTRPDALDQAWRVTTVDLPVGTSLREIKDAIHETQNDTHRRLDQIQESARKAADHAEAATNRAEKSKNSARRAAVAAWAGVLLTALGVAWQIFF